MVGTRVVKIDGCLDQSLPQNTDIEVQIRLRIGGDGSNVMKTLDALHTSALEAVLNRVLYVSRVERTLHLDFESAIRIRRLQCNVRYTDGLVDCLERRPT
jgi:hypothetical protein